MQTSDDESLFLSLNLNVVLKESIPGKFTYIFHFQQIGINPTKIEKTGTHFKKDLFPAIAVINANAPSSGMTKLDHYLWIQQMQKKFLAF